ncbi:CDP-glycerol glycerophosphotransferase family protein [Mumia qirimensis]|uniref:CDP-glycerol glycerophosphotransferase family protein n=1 Tax=Mumia qirimensis TaxID=3234852 RepID=UPI00351D0DA3
MSASLLSRPRRGADRPPESTLRLRLVGDRLRVDVTLGDGLRAERLLLRYRDTGRESTLAPVAPEAGETGTCFDVDVPAAVRADPSCEWIDLWLAVAGDEAPRRAGRFASTERGDAVTPTDVDGLTATVHMTHKGNVSIRVQAERSREVALWTRSLTLRHGRIAFAADVVTHNVRAVSAVLTVTSRESGESTDLPVGLRLLAEDTRRLHGLIRYRVDADFDVRILARTGEHDSDIYDLALVLTLDGFTEPLERGIRIPPYRVRRRLRATDVSDGEAGHLVTPYFSFKAQRLCLRVETYAGADLDFMRRLLRFAWAFEVVRPFTRIWLIGELPYKAQDTGYHFFRWVRLNHPRRRAYYVIEEDSPERAQVEPYGNVVTHRSRRHILYSLVASRLVGSHHAEYLLASRSPRFVRWSRGVRVFLQHGVMGTKNMTGNYGRRASTDFRTDLFLVSSEREREMVVDDFEFFPGQVRVTGLPRFDTLLADDVDVERALLIIPTWRDWLRARDFGESEFFEQWDGLLTSARFQEMIRRHGLTVRFILHPNMRDYAERFHASGVVVLQQGDAPVQDLLKRSAVMITDYSSVGFDFSFLHRPVLYFQFDRARFLGARGSHLDLDSHLPGEIAFSRDEVLDRLDDVLDAGMTISDRNRARADAFLDHRDRDNNARIYEEVRRAWSPLTSWRRLRSAAPSRALFNRFRKSRAYFPAMRVLYRLATLLPRRDLVVFESANGKQYGDSPRYLYEKLLERGTDSTLVWVNDSTVRLPDPGTRKVRRLTPRYFWLLGRASHWINNQNFPHYLRPARGTRYVQTWHGTPLKKMQHDLEHVHGRSDGYLERVTKMTGYWDDLVSPSPYATAAFRTAFRYSGRVIEAGYPRNDVLHHPDREARADLVRRRLGIPAGRRVVLYAPTFRDDRTSGGGFAPQAELDLARLHARFGDSVVVLLRMHSVVRGRPPVPEELRHFAMDVSRYPDTQELLLLADVLVTDYSSVMFDFATMDRPMVFFTYDLDHYRDDLRGFYLPFEEVAPGPLVRTSDEVADALSEALAGSDGYARAREDFRARFAPLDDGSASERVLDAVFGPP